MTASERLRELATNQGGDDVTFTSAEVFVIASLVKAAEKIGASGGVPTDPRIDWYEIQADKGEWVEFLAALTALEEKLG